MMPPDSVARIELPFLFQRRGRGETFKAGLVSVIPVCSC